MSNLYKQWFVTSTGKDARVIDSNQIVEEKIEELARKIRRQAGEEAGFAEGFSEGLGAEQVEVILEEDPVEKAQEEAEKIREEAEKILEEAKAKSEAILIEANRQKEQIHTQAKEEGRMMGYEEGKTRADAEGLQMKKELKQLEDSLNEDYQKKLEEMEPQLVEVVAKVFEKVFHIQFGDKTEILLSLVSDAVMDIEGSKEFRVRVSSVNFEFMESRRREIEERVGEDISLEIIADPLLEENQCTIETDSGVFDCSLGVQLENLIKDLKSLSIDDR